MPGLLASWRRRARPPAALTVRDAAFALYAAALQQSRLPYFYTQCLVPDNINGRFDMVAMHLFLLLNRLRKSSGHQDLIQQLMDVFVDDMDRSLREMGVGDLGVGKRIRVLVEALHGRLDAYRTAFGQNTDAVSAAIARNVYRGVRVKPLAISSLISYFYSQSDYLALQSDQFLRQGRVVFQQPFAEVIS